MDLHFTGLRKPFYVKMPKIWVVNLTGRSLSFAGEGRFWNTGEKTGMEITPSGRRKTCRFATEC